MPAPGAYTYSSGAGRGRAAHASSAPAEARSCAGICPACKKPMTQGVAHRIEELADREAPELQPKDPRRIPLIGLAQILSAIRGVGPQSKRVTKEYVGLLNRFGPEIPFLLDATTSDLEAEGYAQLALAKNKIDGGGLQIIPGFDGQPGQVAF